MTYTQKEPIYEETITINGFTYSIDLATVIDVDKEVMSLDNMQRGVRYIGKGAFAGCENLRIIHIPETVIWIDDFAFRDCPNIRELHLPYYIEYISPLAFTFSEGKSDRFYNCNFEIYFPNETFLKYAYMIPQFVSEERYADYGLILDDLEEIEGYDYLMGIPIYVDEDELYRITIEDYIIRKYPISGCEEFDSEKNTEDIKKINLLVLHNVFDKKICRYIKEKDLIICDKDLLPYDVKMEHEFIISYFVTTWQKESPNMRPIELIKKMVRHFMKHGYCGATGIDVEAYFEPNDMPSVDIDKLLDEYFAHYISLGYHINVQLLKNVVRQSITLMFSIGYSYGCIYNKTHLNIK